MTRLVCAPPSCNTTPAPREGPAPIFRKVKTKNKKKIRFSGHEADAAGGRRDRDFLVQRSRFLAALKTRLGLILAKAVAMRVMINATGCPAPVSDRNRTHTHKHLSQLIELAIDHDIPTPV